MNVNFSITKTVAMSHDIVLGAGQSNDFSAVLVAPKTTGAHNFTINLKLDEYTTTTKTQDYKVRTINSILLLPSLYILW